MNPPDTIPWYQSYAVKASLLGFFPLAVVVARSVFHIDLSQYREEFADWGFALISAGGASWFLVRRIKAGKDPEDPHTEIQAPKIAETISRLTK